MHQCIYDKNAWFLLLITHVINNCNIFKGLMNSNNPIERQEWKVYEPFSKVEMKFTILINQVRVI